MLNPKNISKTISRSAIYFGNTHVILIALGLIEPQYVHKIFAGFEQKRMRCMQNPRNKSKQLLGQQVIWRNIFILVLAGFVEPHVCQ
jgi:hypothetical protein